MPWGIEIRKGSTKHTRAKNNDGWKMMEGWKDGIMDGWRDERMEGWKDGKIDGWMDGRTDGQMDGWTNRYIYRSKHRKYSFNE